METSHRIVIVKYMESSEKQNKSLTELSKEELLEIIFQKDSLERTLRRELKKKEEMLNTCDGYPVLLEVLKIIDEYKKTQFQNSGILKISEDTHFQVLKSIKILKVISYITGILNLILVVFGILCIIAIYYLL